MQIGDEVVLTSNQYRDRRATITGLRGVLFVLEMDNGPQLRVPASMIRPADTPTPQMESEPVDFDRGFGIGGINRYQPTAAEEMALLDQEIAHAEREERRVRRGPVCVDCGLCEQHCDC